jgi:hypothetical protein
MALDVKQFLNRSEVRSINAAKLYYATKIHTFAFNQLEIEIEESYVNEAKRGQIPSGVPPELIPVYAGGASIEANPLGKAFRLTFKLCAAYSVTEELVGSCGDYAEEKYEGVVLRVYSKSNFLEHLGRDTGGHTADLKHIKLVTLNHLIDIGFYDWPEILQLSGQSPSAHLM